MTINEQVKKFVTMGVVSGQHPAIVNVMTNEGGIVSGDFNTYIMTVDSDGINLFDISQNEQYNPKGDLKILYTEIANTDIRTANMGITKYFVVTLKNNKWLPLIFNYRMKDYEPQKSNIIKLIEFITNHQN